MGDGIIKQKGGSMRRGFTLLELLIVIIIVGVMATLGLTQYTAVVERSRGAEARQILGQLRSLCAALYMDGSNVSMCNNTTLGLGNGSEGTIPSNNSCQPSHFFLYSRTLTEPHEVVFLAERCTSGGKTPNRPSNANITLTANYSSGNATWVSPFGF
jgi:prepilin-type N-terminal cleavage/methylation domain-containing protein